MELFIVAVCDPSAGESFGLNVPDSDLIGLSLGLAEGSGCGVELASSEPVRHLGGGYARLYLRAAVARKKSWPDRLYAAVIPSSEVPESGFDPVALKTQGVNGDVRMTPAFEPRSGDFSMDLGRFEPGRYAVVVLGESDGPRPK